MGFVCTRKSAPKNIGDVPLSRPVARGYSVAVNDPSSVNQEALHGKHIGTGKSRDRKGCPQARRAAAKTGREGTRGSHSGHREDRSSQTRDKAAGEPSRPDSEPRDRRSGKAPDGVNSPRREHARGTDMEGSMPSMSVLTPQQKNGAAQTRPSPSDSESANPSARPAVDDPVYDRNRQRALLPLADVAVARPPRP